MRTFVKLVIVDVLTFGIPLYAKNLYQSPKQTLKITALIFLPVLLFVWLILS